MTTTRLWWKCWNYSCNALLFSALLCCVVVVMVLDGCWPMSERYSDCVHIPNQGCQVFFVNSIVVRSRVRSEGNGDYQSFGKTPSCLSLMVLGWYRGDLLKKLHRSVMLTDKQWWKVLRRASLVIPPPHLQYCSATNMHMVFVHGCEGTWKLHSKHIPAFSQ